MPKNEQEDPNTKNRSRGLKRRSTLRQFEADTSRVSIRQYLELHTSYLSQPNRKNKI